VRSEQRSVRYVVQAALASAALLLVAPVLAVAAIGIKLSSRGPVLYRARRIARDRRRLNGGVLPFSLPAERRQPGYGGREFTLFKLRTMHLHQPTINQAITGRNDPRVFGFGALLRKTKIDELPQLLNIIRGDMALVGPRPEDPDIVRKHYRPNDLQTLQVPPGLTSPGSLYYYTRCEDQLPDTDATTVYAEQLLPIKLDLDRVYINDASLFYDARIVLRTIGVIVGRLFGRQRFPNPPEASKLDMLHR
jgi:lipopolysaccharide/colanic/teichoic acid biosynthesis glycosyltransferase